MAVTDEILTRYKLDIQQPEQAMNKYAQTLMQAEEVGEKAFAGIGQAAELSGQRIANTGRIVEKSKSQFNSLGNSINQISRELPAFTMNLNTGFLAISNNLPALSDAINQIRKQNIELAASGKQTVSVLGSIAGALFSWQTALSIGITLLTAYGAKIIDFIAGNKEAKKSDEELRKEEEKLNDERMRGVRILEQINVQRNKDVSLAQKYRSVRAGGLEFQRAELELLKAKGATDEEVFNKEQSIRQNEILDLKERLNALEQSGDDRLDVMLEIQSRERMVVLAKEKFDSEQDEKARKRAKERAEFEQKLREGNAKRAATDRELAASEITRITDEYFAEKDREKKADEDAARQKRELLGESVLEAKRTRERTRMILSEQASDERQSYQNRLEALKRMRDEFLITEQEYSEASEELEKNRQDVFLRSLSAIGGAFGAFAQLLGETTEAGKALAIVQTTIDTYVAAQRAYTAMAGIPVVGPALGILAAAGAVAAGLDRVSQISQTQVPKPKITPPSAQSRGFKDGVVNLDGPGTATSDSIPVWLSRGESVITAKSTSAKRDDLLALNKSVPDYEALLFKKYVKPAVDAEQRKQNQFVENIARSIAMHTAFNDARIVKAIEKNRPATGKDIQRLTESIEKRDRITKFESNLKQSK